MNGLNIGVSLKNMLLHLRDRMKVRRNRVIYFVLGMVIVASMGGCYFVSNDEGFYDRTIAQITSIQETEAPPIYDSAGKVEQMYQQDIKAVIRNGKYKGVDITLKNQYSFSKIYDNQYKVKDEVFLNITEDSVTHTIKAAQIIDLKRDNYIAYIAFLFILLILLIGGSKGLRSLASVIINVVIFAIVIELYIKGYNLILLAVIAALLFILVSIALVSGINKKSVSAVIGTIAGTLLSMIITLIVIWITKGNGIHYEEIEFMTRPPEQIFLVEILVGTLGGIMDIAISISSAVKEMFDSNPDMDWGIVLKSGMEIGRDIMGTMANTLVFAYISGSIPMILLWMKNGFSSFEIISFNLSFEVIRALTGSIGIVISIPITLFISVLLLSGNQMEESK